MIKTVKNFLKENDIKNKKIIVGYSCGPDSTALALALNSVKKEYHLEIVLAYFNHGWREEAKKEEEFTKQFAKKLNIEYYISKAPKNSRKTEEEARNLRYDFFEKCAELYNSKYVFLAHNKNDNIETLIYRIIKGTSPKGLASIPQIRDIYYRPLLETEKSEILDFLKSHNQNYLTDSSNNDIKYNRNYIRNEILPKFEKINPNYINSINSLIKTSVQNKKIIEECLNKEKIKIIKDGKIIKSEFMALDISLRYEFLNDLLKDKLKNRDFKTIKKFDDFIRKNSQSKCSINKNEFLIIKNNKIYIEKICKKNESSLLIKKEGEYLFEDKTIIIKKIKTKDIKNITTAKNKCYLSFDFPIELRHRKTGDIFSPYGLKNGKMKLKDYLINEKVEQSQKDKLLLLCKEHEVCWIVTKKISEKYKAKDDISYKIIVR